MRQSVRYYTNAIYWNFNSKLHRDGNLPARYYFIAGEVDIVFYYQHDELHCATGPAIVAYCSKNKWYCYQGREYASLGEMQMVETCR